MSSLVPWPPTVRPWRPEGPKRGDVSFQPPIPSLAAKDFAILNPAILSLAAAGFAVVTTEFVIVGLLPMLAASFAITVPQAGLLVTLFAFTVALFGPLLTVAAARIERRALFVGIMALFAVADILAAAAPNLSVMVIARLIPALALPVFWSVASATAAQLVPPERAGRAVAAVFTGITVATVIGVPVGTLIAAVAGWRMTFAVIAALCAATAVLIAVLFPRIVPKPAGTLRSQAAILKRGKILAYLALSTVVFTAMFAGYTYLADFLGQVTGFDDTAVGWILMGFGALGVFGNWAGGRIVDRAPLFTTILATGLLTVTTAIAAPAAAAGWQALFIVLAAWGFAQGASFVVNQVRVMKAAPENAQAFAASLNVSVCNVGIGLGAIIGGRAVALFGIGRVDYVAAAIGLAALAIAVATGLAIRRRPVRLAVGGA
jgi:MFS transporter, DHA1 family, inner membrane transport protein